MAIGSGKARSRPANGPRTLVKHQQGQKWYSYQVNAVSDGAEANQDMIANAGVLFENELELYKKSVRSSSGSEASWLQTVLTKGTAGDRMTAIQLEITNSPIHSLKYVEQLVRQCEKKALREALDTIQGEKSLLSGLVNKLGHPNYKIGARVAFLLEKLCHRHSVMRSVIVNEVEHLVYRKNVHPHAHLYAATFLSQMPFWPGDSDLAVRMLTIYFGLFKILIARKKFEDRLLRILLTAANRAFPYAKAKAESLVADMDTLFKLVHTGNFVVAVQTLRLIFQVLELSASLSDRYYSALYKLLLDHIPTNMYQQVLSLVYKSLKNDTLEKRVRSFVKRLLQVALSEAPPMSAAILFLISKLAQERPQLVVTRREPDRMVPLRDPKTIQWPPSKEEKDADEEVYVDLDDSGKPIARKQETDADVKPEKGTVAPTKISGWVHKDNKTHKGSSSLYDANSRNPLYTDVEDYVDLELAVLSKSFHPSVALFAKNLQKGELIRYSGDPLEDFAPMRFLDRFAYKNPKERKNLSSSKVVHKKLYDPWGVRKLKVSSKEYLTKRTEEIPTDERYLHRFAILKFQPKDDAEHVDNWDEVESVGSDEIDRILEKLEPGEANDDFEVDFGQEFSVEKKAKGKKALKRAADGDDDEETDEEGESDDDEDVEDVDIDDDDEDMDEGVEDEEDEDDWDDDVMEMEGEGSDDDDATRKSKPSKDPFDDDSDGDFGSGDAFMAADKFAEMLEDGGEEELQRKIKKHKTRKPKGYKKSR
ncbi:unnamed protein product, partial [Mesorhabditis spiculigera]